MLSDGLGRPPGASRRIPEVPRLNGDRLVCPKTELIAVLWPEAVAVGDGSQVHCIRDVRHAWAMIRQGFIRTVTGRGYISLGRNRSNDEAQEDQKPDQPLLSHRSNLPAAEVHLRRLGSSQVEGSV